MSPEALATEHLYRRLKSEILDGRYRPGDALQIHAIAQRHQMSVSPVRDAMQRMVGERLLGARTGGGFELPCLPVNDVIDLHLWLLHILREIVRTCDLTMIPREVGNRIGTVEVTDPFAIAQAETALFMAVSEAGTGREQYHAACSAIERLHVIRISEGNPVDRKLGLLRIWNAVQKGNRTAIRATLTAYHHRRLKELKNASMA